MKNGYAEVSSFSPSEPKHRFEHQIYTRIFNRLGVTVAGDGSVLITDRFSNRVLRVDEDDLDGHLAQVISDAEKALDQADIAGFAGIRDNRRDLFMMRRALVTSGGFQDARNPIWNTKNYDSEDMSPSLRKLPPEDLEKIREFTNDSRTPMILWRERIAVKRLEQMGSFPGKSPIIFS